jgi:hypothetical protein
MSGNEERKLSSLRDLPRDIAPPRDLWQGIEAQIAADRAAVLEAPARRGASDGRRRVLAAAAMIAALAVGIWIGRVMMPVGGVGIVSGSGMIADVGTRSGGAPAGGQSMAGPGTTAGAMAGGEPGAFHAAYVMNSKYLQQRARLVKDLEARLAALPPDSRAKVVSSLQTLSDSKRDLERELGKDPSNALLQELLVNTYQDEMRVLTAVHEAGSAGEGI